MTPDQAVSRQMRQEHPYRAYKREQEIISRRKIYRTTAFYSSYSIILLVLAIRSHHLLRAIAFVPAGIALWMLTEYFSHRFILHRHWKISQRRYKRFWTRVANKYFDPLHFGHHEKPFDGEHMSGRVKDLLPLFLLGVPLSILLFPPFTASVVVAAAFQSYIAEEWIHHATHLHEETSSLSSHVSGHDQGLWYQQRHTRRNFHDPVPRERAPATLRRRKTVRIKSKQTDDHHTARTILR
jgi:hypothetical protein